MRYSADRIRAVDLELFYHNPTRFTESGIEKLRNLARRPMSEETRQKIAESKRGRIHSRQTIKNIAVSCRVSKLNRGNQCHLQTIS